MAFLLSLAALFEIGLVALVTCTPVNPRDPTITQRALLPRKEDGPFIGYLLSYNGKEPVLLSSYVENSDYTMSISGTLAYFCDTAVLDWEASCAASFRTTCTDSMIYASEGSFICNESCGYDYIITDNYSGSDPILTFWRCVTSAYKTFLQVDPRVDPDLSYLFTTSPTPSPTTLSSSATPIPTGSSLASETSSSIPISVSTLTPAPAPAPGKEANKAWIAGPVIGGLALIAVAGLSFYLIRRRRGNQEQPYQVAPQMAAFSPQQPNAEGFVTPLPPPGYYDPKSHDSQSLVSQDYRLSQNTNPNTVSMCSQNAPGTVATSTVRGSIQELPELVQPPRSRA